MLLQNFFDKRITRFIAAVCLTTIVLSSCQEPIRRSVDILSEDRTAATLESRFQMTKEEFAFAKELANDPIHQELVKEQALLLIKMKLAITKDRASLRNALLKNDSKEYAKVLGFSNEEFESFQANHKRIAEEWQKRFGNRKEILEKISNKHKCSTCNSLPTGSTLDIQLDKIASADISSAFSTVSLDDAKNASSLQACDTPWKKFYWDILVAACFAAAIGCAAAITGASLGTAVWATPACVVVWLACVVGAQCEACKTCE